MALDSTLYSSICCCDILFCIHTNIVCRTQWYVCYSQFIFIVYIYIVMYPYPHCCEFAFLSRMCSVYANVNKTFLADWNRWRLTTNKWLNAATDTKSISSQSHSQTCLLAYFAICTHLLFEIFRIYDERRQEIVNVACALLLLLLLVCIVYVRNQVSICHCVVCAHVLALARPFVCSVIWWMR